MIIGQTVSVTRGPAWKLTDEFTHIASNTSVPSLSTFTNIFSICFQLSSSFWVTGVVSTDGPAFCLEKFMSCTSCGSLSAWKIVSLFLSQSLYPYLLDRRRTWESHDFACRQQLDDVPRDSRSLHPARNRRRGGIHTHTHHPPDGDGIGWWVVLQMTAPLGWWINV